jgi:hypothetical protein
MKDKYSEEFFLQALSDDVVQAIRDLDEEDSPCRRRALVRAVFANIEGTVYYLKIRTLRRAKGNFSRFSPAELAMLREETYSVNARGHARTRRRYTPIPENFRFTMSMFMRGVLPNFRLDLTDDGWVAFCESVEVRNRITHPKSAESLDVTRAEIDLVNKAYRWFVRTTLLSFCNGIDYQDGELKRLKQAKQRLKHSRKSGE